MMYDYVEMVVVGFICLIVGFSIAAVLYGAILNDAACPVRLDSIEEQKERCDNALDYCKQKLDYKTYKYTEE